MEYYPKLIENSAKNYLFQTLKQCHNNRVTIYYYVYNIGIFLIFVSIVGLTLYYCSKNKLSDYEKRQRMMRDQQYILSKIRYYKEDVQEQRQKQSDITNLPFVSQ
jgi:uncharacterized membrane protein